MSKMRSVTPSSVIVVAGETMMWSMLIGPLFSGPVWRSSSLARRCSGTSIVTVDQVAQLLVGGNRTGMSEVPLTVSVNRRLATPVPGFAFA